MWLYSTSLQCLCGDFHVLPQIRRSVMAWFYYGLGVSWDRLCLWFSVVKCVGCSRLPRHSSWDWTCELTGNIWTDFCLYLGFGLKKKKNGDTWIWLLSLRILLCHAQVVLNCVDLFIICLNKKTNHKHTIFVGFLTKKKNRYMLLCQTTHACHMRTNSWDVHCVPLCSLLPSVAAEDWCNLLCGMHYAQNWVTGISDFWSGSSFSHGEIHHLQTENQ